MPLVGTKGQVVISKEIRDELGIKPGWLAIERVVDGEVRLTFLPPVTGSRLGALSDVITLPPPGTDWNKIREAAWDAAAWDQEFGPDDE